MSCTKLASAKTAITDTELNQTYSGATPGLLPTSSAGPSDRDNNKILTKNKVKSIIDSLKSSGIIPTLSGNSELFMKKQNELINNIQAEYCFYEARYIYILNKLFSTITSGAKIGKDNTNEIQPVLVSTQVLNQKLNDLTQIINGVLAVMLSSSSEIKTGFFLCSFSLLPYPFGSISFFSVSSYSAGFHKLSDVNQ